MKAIYSRSAHPLRAAFTLVELLVVITIISILVALIFPTTRLIKERGNIATCGNNLGQLWHAMKAYSVDNAGSFPINEGTSGADKPSWVEGAEVEGTNGVLTITQGSLWRYTGELKVYRCLSMPDQDYVRSYSMMDCFSGLPIGNTQITFNGITVDRATKFIQVERPSSTPLLAEENSPSVLPNDGRAYITDGQLKRSSGRRFGNYHIYHIKSGNRAEGKCHMVFVDGHLELVTPDQADFYYENFFHVPIPH